MIIPLHGKKAAGRVAIIDADDYELVCGHLWYALETGRKSYAYTNKSRLYMHKLITGYVMTDHINGNGLDNRRVNLRPATKQENARNMEPHSGCSSPFKGVCWNKLRRTWMAYIDAEANKRIYLGTFRDEIEAAQAYDAAAREYFGEFAWLNFPHQASR